LASIGFGKRLPGYSISFNETRATALDEERCPILLNGQNASADESCRERGKSQGAPV
jgi:hypothetical protein